MSTFLAWLADIFTVSRFMNGSRRWFGSNRKKPDNDVVYEHETVISTTIKSTTVIRSVERKSSQQDCPEICGNLVSNDPEIPRD